jgi:flagellar biosynthesis/type III secretory pathway protein FliH
MLAQLEKDAPVTIRMNPADIELLESRLDGSPLLPDRDDPRVVPDRTLARGECRVESGDTILLSDVTRELQEIRDDLLRSLGNARP